MTLRRTIVSLLYLYGLQRATVAASAIQRSPAPTATHNNFACRSAIHPNPVRAPMLHYHEKILLVK